MATRKHRLRLAALLGGLAVLLFALGAVYALPAALFTPSNTTAQTTDWTVFTSPTEQFKISFPTTPTRVPPEGSQSVNGVSYATYYSKPTNDGLYALFIFNIPTQMDTSDDKTILNDSANNTVKHVHGTLVSSKPSTFKGYPSLDYVIVKEDGTYQNNKDILVDHTYYGLTNSEPTNSFPNFSRFVNSFQLVGQ